MNLNHKFKNLQIPLPDDINRLKCYGDFQKAMELIDKKLISDNNSQALVNSLLVQKEIMLRLPGNYPYSKVEAIEKIKKSIPDFTEIEFNKRIANREIDWIYIQGIPHYFDRFYESLIKTDVDFARRAGVSLGKNPLEEILQKLKRNKIISNRITIKASVRIKDDYFEPGKLVRVHLPIPCDCPQQSEIRIENIEPSNGHISPENACQRTVYWEEEMWENHPFTVEYSYIYTAKYNDINSILPNGVDADFDINEQAPHIVFTPYIKELTNSIIGDLSCPLEKARAIYDFITLNMKYSFMRSYFCLENIAETGALNLRGDCGVMALLFITLCRCAGIAARWQSGLIARPDFCGAHDWTIFYIAPYGWLYADPSFGSAAVREGNEDKRKFYFGNLDPFRMVANTEFQEDFTNPKKFWREDPYDNQVGEIETIDRGLQYFQFYRSKEIIGFEEL